MGDVVEALSQWVVSKNFTPEGNIAGHYIKKIQTNQNRFEMITGTIRKYNLSLKYAKEGNLDMAVIQLKKVVANNPQLIKAHLLLALIYIKQDELSRAKKLLNAVLAIDKNNTLAHIYQKEIAERNAAKKAETSGSFLPKRKEKDIDKKPLSGNDVILPRSYYKKTLQEYSDQLSSGNVELNSMQKELEEVKAQKDALEQQLGVVNGTEGSNKLLVSVIEAASDYIANKPDDAANKLVDIDVSALPSESAKTLYNTIATATLPAAAQTFYNTGMTEYYKSNYEVAADNLVKAYKCNNSADSAYYAAKSYVALAKTDDAKKYYKYIVDDYSTSGYYKEASDYVNSH